MVYVHFHAGCMEACFTAISMCHIFKKKKKKILIIQCKAVVKYFSRVIIDVCVMSLNCIEKYGCKVLQNNLNTMYLIKLIKLFNYNSLRLY
jgi:hypothetical protein